MSRCLLASETPELHTSGVCSMYSGDHLGWNVEAYVDDIVVKSRKADDLVADLRIAFDCLRGKTQP